MIPVRDIALAALGPVLRRAPLTPEKVAFAWRAVVGPKVAEATSSIAFESGVLQVTARDVAWRNELERSAGLIRRRINEVLSEDIVKGLNVRLG